MTRYSDVGAALSPRAAVARKRACERPPSTRASAGLGRLEAHELAQERIEALALAGVEVDPADLLHETLEALKLLEPEEKRVLLHELGGVEERTRRRGLFLAADEVGLRRPLRLHHLVHEEADLAGKDHVLHAELADLDARLHQTLAHESAQLRVEHALGRQHLVERACRHRLADREL